MKKVFALLLAIAMVFALGACGGKSGGGIGGGSNGDYKAAINLFLKVKYENAADKIEDLAPKTFWDFYEDTYNMPRKSMIDEIKYVIEQTEIELIDHFGKGYKMKVTMSQESEVSKDDLSKIAAAFEQQKGIKAADIKGAYKVNVSVAFDGQNAWEEFTVGAVKIGKTWYAANWDIYDEGTAVRFMMEELPFAG